MKRAGWRARLGWRLRCWADRFDRDHATFVSGWSFTFEPHVGVVFRDDGRGCPVAYFGSETYDRAHTEAGPVALDRIHSTKVWVPATADDRTLSFMQRQARARWWHLLGHAAGHDVR